MRSGHFTLRCWRVIRIVRTRLCHLHTWTRAAFAHCLSPASPPCSWLQAEWETPLFHRPASSCISSLQPLVYSIVRHCHVSVWHLAPVGQAVEAAGQWRVGAWEGRQMPADPALGLFSPCPPPPPPGLSPHSEEL